MPFVVCMLRLIFRFTHGTYLNAERDEHPEEAEEATIIEQQAAQLENELAMKERETLIC
jgi:hypothetical protein